MALFNSPFKHKFIYVFSIPDEAHKGLLKIGETTVTTEHSLDELPANCAILNKLAKERIRSYTNTAAIDFQLLHTQLAIIQKVDEDGTLKCTGFRDIDVHKVLTNSGLKKETIGTTTGREWFKVDMETVRSAIECVKKGEFALPNSSGGSSKSSIIFRPEQIVAIDKTVKRFKNGNRMLWNAKMRFGKTLCALEVVKRLNVQKTIIVTHRPVVNESWYEDFKNIFYNKDQFAYGSKANDVTVEQLIDSEKQFIYFASVQDLRGSEKVGGKFEKNDIIFSTDWDCVVVDEAHEGTTTSLGEKVVSELVKSDSATKFLALSGTPFNIVSEYKEDEVFTWDYVMEQRAKNEWDIKNYGDYNPYSELPTLHIYTYSLGKLINSDKYDEIQDKAFHFREFFRTWTGKVEHDFKDMPPSCEVGDFVHESDVSNFLDLITKYDKNSQYPYANEEYRDLFQHTLWMVTGVKEARALSKLLKSHEVFGASFDIINVAGDGDFEEESDEALTMVKRGIAEANSMGRHSITLSCGKLTTGVTVPEWTAVFMLSGSFNTAAANYLQTIFRVQSPCRVDGKRKENCYVFDFAPDRTLKMVAEAVNLSTKAGQTSQTDRINMKEFLNFCPVISADGTGMVRFNEDKLLQHLKRAYAEKAVKSGFDDNSIYDHTALMKLSPEQLEQFNDLREIVGRNQAIPKKNDVIINETGLDQEENPDSAPSDEPKEPKVTSEQEEERKRRLQEERKLRDQAISNLRAVSIRIPLLIYGADVEFDENISAEQLINLVDDTSWEEFMPINVTKKLFKNFVRYYDTDVFIAAGKRIRAIAKEADTLPPTERVKRIVELFSWFKNPDKETVLTPWKTVNRHMTDCLGGYNFFDTDFSSVLESPSLVNKEDITKKTLLKTDSKILEINSKTGLYPLFLTYTIFRSKCPDINTVSVEEQNQLWAETVAENIFVICKTPMAKTITKRTLVGYKDYPVHSHYVADLINTMKNESTKFVSKVTKPKFWGEKGSEIMNFQAIVGNPPYQKMDGGAKASASPIYQYFVQTAKNIEPEFISFIMPSRWFAGGKGLDEFRDQMLNDSSVREIHDFLDPDEIFPHTNIRGGVCYFLWDKDYDNETSLTRVVSHNNNQIESDVKRTLKSGDSNIFLRDPLANQVIGKIFTGEDVENFMKYTSSRKPFGLATNFNKTDDYHETKDSLINPLICYGKGMKIGYVERTVLSKRVEHYIDQWKVYLSRANNVGTELSDDNLNGFLGSPNTVCTESYLMIGVGLVTDEISCNNLIKYLQTKFARFLHSLAKASQDATAKTYQFVPVEDFSSSSPIDWSKPVDEIDQQLFNKYHLSVEEQNYIRGKIKAMK